MTSYPSTCAKLGCCFNWVIVVSCWIALMGLPLTMPTVAALNNGLARTPPMGWMSRQRFGCNIDCATYPDDCISERLVKSTADAMVSRGLRDAGYTYVVLDDCWMDSQRDSNGRLQADRTRFPSGIQNVIAYVQSIGLKFGLYIDLGNKTCGGFPGSRGNLSTDATTLAAWNVDLVKVGSCGLPTVDSMNRDYVTFGGLLNQTGRPMIYVCEWPQAVRSIGGQVDMNAVVNTCNQYRTYNSIQDSWLSLTDIFQYYGSTNRIFHNFSLPGSYNDPDQLVIGDYGLSDDQQRVQMAMWSIMAAPLFVSADIRVLNHESTNILLNTLALVINQDPLGDLGVQIQVTGQLYIWRKSIQPSGSWAIALFYTNIAGGPNHVSIVLTDLGLQSALYGVTEVFSGRYYGLMKPWFTLNCEVNPNSVLFFRFVAM